MATVIIVKAGNPIEVVEDFEITLESLQNVVGGYIEAVSVTDTITMWINEEGKLYDLDANFFISGRFSDCIVGNVIFTSTNSQGESVSLNDNEINEIKSRFISRNTFII